MNELPQIEQPVIEQPTRIDPAAELALPADISVAIDQPKQVQEGVVDVTYSLSQSDYAIEVASFCKAYNYDENTTDMTPQDFYASCIKKYRVEVVSGVQRQDLQAQLQKDHQTYNPGE